MYFLIAIINIVTTFILVKRVGIVGAALSTAGATVFGNGLLMNWYYTKKINIDIKRFWHEIFKLFLPMVFATAVIKIIYSTFIVARSWLSIFLAVLLYFLLQFSILWFAGFNDYEKKLITSAIKLPCLR